MATAPPTSPALTTHPSKTDPVRVVDGAGAVVCEHCELAETYLGRLRGLLGRRGLAPGHGLLLRPCSSVHTAFMRFPIDVVLLDRDMAVIGVRSRVDPWRMVAARGTRGVLELAAGQAEARGVSVGDHLLLRPRT